jgi:hypothetical protein
MLICSGAQRALPPNLSIALDSCHTLPPELAEYYLGHSELRLPAPIGWKYVRALAGVLSVMLH